MEGVGRNGCVGLGQRKLKEVELERGHEGRRCYWYCDVGMLLSWKSCSMIWHWRPCHQSQDTCILVLNLNIVDHSISLDWLQGLQAMICQSVQSWAVFGVGVGDRVIAGLGFVCGVSEWLSIIVTVVLAQVVCVSIGF